MDADLKLRILRVTSLDRIFAYMGTSQQLCDFQQMLDSINQNGNSVSNRGFTVRDVVWVNGQGHCLALHEGRYWRAKILSADPASDCYELSLVDKGLQPSATSAFLVNGIGRREATFPSLLNICTVDCWKTRFANTHRKLLIRLQDLVGRGNFPDLPVEVVGTLANGVVRVNLLYLDDGKPRDFLRDLQDDLFYQLVSEHTTGCRVDAAQQQPHIGSAQSSPGNLPQYQHLASDREPQEPPSSYSKSSLEPLETFMRAEVRYLLQKNSLDCGTLQKLLEYVAEMYKVEPESLVNQLLKHLTFACDTDQLAHVMRSWPFGLDHGFMTQFLVEDLACGKLIKALYTAGSIAGDMGPLESFVAQSIAADPSLQQRLTQIVDPDIVSALGLRNAWTPVDGQRAECLEVAVDATTTKFASIPSTLQATNLSGSVCEPAEDAFRGVRRMLEELDLQRFVSLFEENMIIDDMLSDMSHPDLVETLKQIQLPSAARASVIQYVKAEELADVTITPSTSVTDPNNNDITTSGFDSASSGLRSRHSSAVSSESSLASGSHLGRSGASAASYSSKAMRSSASGGGSLSSGVQSTVSALPVCGNCGSEYHSKANCPQGYIRHY